MALNIRPQPSGSIHMSTEVSTASDTDRKITPVPRNLGLALAVIAAAQLMVVLDATIVNIALPSIQRALQFTPTGLEWVINAYALTFGGLLLLGGRAGDLFGRRRMFVVGIVVFTLGSLAGGFANSATWLIIARAAQGIGAAIVAPTALSLIADTFREGPDRNRALGVYGVLFVNVPIGIVLAIVAPRVLAASPGRDGRLDLPGAFTATGGMVLLVYGLSRAATYSWTDTVTLTSLGLAATLLLVFVAIESRSRHALMPFRIFAQRNRDGAYVLSLVIGVAVFGVFFFLTQFVQNILGFSPLVAGVAFLPLTAAIIITAQIVARLVGRFGPRPFITIGPLLVAGGLFWLSQINDHTMYLTGLVGPMLLIAVGMGNIFVPLTLMAVAGTTPEESGLASALLNVGQQIGGSIGIALLGTIAATTTKNQLAGVLPSHAAVNHALTAGYGAGFQVAVAIALFGFAVALAVFGTPRVPQTTPVAEEAAA